MRTKRLLSVALLTCLGSFLVGLVALAGPGDVAVTSFVSDYDSGIAPALQIQSDKLGAYTNSKTLTSVIQSVGSWLLNVSDARNTTRTLYLGFNQPIAASGPNGGDPVAVPSGHYKARIISKCNVYNNNMFTLPGGATMTCPLHATFDYAGASYGVRMNPSYDVGTNPVNITCIFPSTPGAACSQWKIWPSGTYITAGGTLAAGNVGRLSRVTTSKGQTVEINQGDFYFSFLIIVMRP